MEDFFFCKRWIVAYCTLISTEQINKLKSNPEISCLMYFKIPSDQPKISEILYCKFLFYLPAITFLDGISNSLATEWSCIFFPFMYEFFYFFSENNTVKLTYATLMIFRTVNKSKNESNYILSILSLYCEKRKTVFNWLLKGTLMQIWKSPNIFKFIRR